METANGNYMMGLVSNDSLMICNNGETAMHFSHPFLEHYNEIELPNNLLKWPSELFLSGNTEQKAYWYIMKIN